MGFDVASGSICGSARMESSRVSPIFDEAVEMK
jgi:hypothetical protein